MPGAVVCSVRWQARQNSLPYTTRACWLARIKQITLEDAGEETSFCGIELSLWLANVGAEPKDVWPACRTGQRNSIWDARLFPAVEQGGDYRPWLWMLDPSNATNDERDAWRAADRYSLKEILSLADHQEFYDRRGRIRAEQMRGALWSAFRPSSGFSACELAYLMRDEEERQEWIRDP